jgi:hypothetical protein
MPKSKPRKRKGDKRPRPGRPLRTYTPFDDPDDVSPFTYQGRVITSQVIAEMRAAEPEHADQLDDAWEQMVLENNRPWIEDPQRLEATERLWAEMRSAMPEHFGENGDQSR